MWHLDGKPTEDIVPKGIVFGEAAGMATKEIGLIADLHAAHYFETEQSAHASALQQ